MPTDPQIRALVVDPSAYSLPYDDALCAALGRAGADATLVTSRFVHGEPPVADGYRREEAFYRRVPPDAGPARRRAIKLSSHVADMRALARRDADVRHFQWAPVPWLDAGLLGPRPRVLTVHNTAPRSDRLGRARAWRAVIERMDALVVHSAHGRERLRQGGVDPGRVHVIPHGALELGPPGDLPPELADDGSPVVLMFGLLRPYKGLDALLAAWAGISGAQLWVVGRALMALPPAPERATFVPRFTSPGEASALMRRADVVVLPYARDERIDASGVLAAALAAGRAAVVSDVGGLAEVAAAGGALAVPPGDPDALRTALAGLLDDPTVRADLGARAAALAAGPYGWDAIAADTLAVYGSVRR